MSRSSNVLRGATALVTGASSGLGLYFARDLAARGCNLVLVARRQELLHQQQQELNARFGVHVDVVAMDLSARDAPQRLYDQLKAKGTRVDVLINNAGFGLWGLFLELPWERERSMLELDIITVVHLTKLFVHDMVARNFGFVLQVASIGAYQPSPSYASYGAAKSFVLNFGEALNFELRKTNVKVTVLSPGVTATEFFQTSGQQEQMSLFQRLTIRQPHHVVRVGIEAMLAGRPSVVSDWLNQLLVFTNRFVPRRISTLVAYLLMRIS
jgi:hypothetical protein